MIVSTVQRHHRYGKFAGSMRRARAVAALVALETQELQGSFSDNAFTMTPWEDRTVAFTSTGSPALSEELLRKDITIMSVQKAME